MSGPFPAWRYGDIVIVAGLLDPRGRNPKDRACVVVSETTPDGEGESVDVVAITTVVPNPLPSDHVLLPWHASRHPRTGLTRRNAAVCSWLVAVDTSRIERTIGSVPGRSMLEIAAVLRMLRGSE